MRGGALIRVTIACPEALIGDANQLALCLGFGSEDAHTYGAACWLDAEGNRYAVASTLVEDGFAADALSPLADPPWGADMAAATQAQSVVAVFGVAEDEGSPAAQPDRITAIVLDDPQAAIVMLGLSQLVIAGA